MTKVIITAACAVLTLSLVACNYNKEYNAANASYNAEESNYATNAANYSENAAGYNETNTYEANNTANSVDNNLTNNAY